MPNIAVAIVLCLFVSAGYSEVIAKEVASGADGVRDWNRSERLRYSQASQTKTGPELVAFLPVGAKGFSSAVNANTQALRFAEYSSVAERNAYYDLISLVIQFEPTTPAAVQPVRFFHATTIVTLRSLLGFPTLYAGSGFEQVAPQMGLCFSGAGTTKDFVERVNAKLFAVNMPVVNNLLFKWKRPQHPSSGASTQIDAYAFDLAMVDLEQGTVQQELQAANPSAAVLAELNKLFACGDGTGVTGSFLSRYSALGDAKKWADNARGAPFDFTVKAHRVQLGKALVTLLHKKTEADFRHAVGL